MIEFKATIDRFTVKDGEVTLVVKIPQSEGIKVLTLTAPDVVWDFKVAAEEDAA